MTVGLLAGLLAVGLALIPVPARAHHHRLQAGGFDGLVLALAPDPADPAILYAGVFGQGVFKTTDGGETWTAASEGLPDLSVRALLADAARAGRVFAGTDAGIAVSTDGGRSWRSAGLPLRSVRVLVTAPAGTLYAGTEEGLYASDDAGGTWREENAGLTAKDLRALVRDPGTGTLYAGAFGGLFARAPRAVAWEPAAAGLPDLHVRALAVDSAGRLYAGTAGAGVFRSEDGGRSWQTASRGLAHPVVLTLLAGPRPGQVLAGTLGGLFGSSDGAGQWRYLGNRATFLSFTSIVRAADGEGTLYAASGGLILKSTDGGERWVDTSGTVRRNASGPAAEDARATPSP
ncbi:MAG: hypothetical protein HY575_00660, partial [candidate division NC10 bacterium]|nr:hypothetical protein [candidate division NC10 bacterium]